MKVFITGGSGFIGTAVVKDLLKNGHEIIAIARSDSSATKLSNLSSKVEVIKGDLEDLDVLKKGASEADGVIHLGFVHGFTDFEGYEKSCEVDKNATEAMLSAIEGTNKPFIYTSGLSPNDGTKLGVETDPIATQIARGRTQVHALSAKDRGIRVMSIGLPPTVHGEGDKGFVPTLMKISKEKGKALYIGEGKNAWAAVHRDDAAVLYTLALTHGKAGSAYHCVGEEKIETKTMVTAYAKKVGVPAESSDPPQVMGMYGFIGFMLTINVASSSKLTQEELGWKPVHPTLIEDIEKYY